MNLLNLPSVMLFEIFEYLPYDEVSKKRLVCRRIDQICQNVLNCGFNKVVRQHALSFKRIKSLLPRRESERRNHCLARHADILTSIETRISMLSMTYSKYMDLSLCCFIPGRVLDEILRILRLIAKTTKPLRPHEVLQELRDISSMAIEHFDEKIANTLKKSIADGRTSRVQSVSGNHGGESSRSSLNMSGLANVIVSSVSAANTTGGRCGQAYCCNSIRQRVNTLLSLSAGDVHRVDVTDTSCSSSSTSVAPCLAETPHVDAGCPEGRIAMQEYKKLELEHKKGVVKLQRIQQIQMHQSRRLQQAMNTISDLTAQVIELKKRLEDVDAKNREISANIKQINTGEPAAATASELTEASKPMDSATTETTTEAEVVVAPTAVADAVETAGTTAALGMKRRHESSTATYIDSICEAAVMLKKKQKQ